MAEFENERIGVSFTLPDEITVREQLRYKIAMWIRWEAQPDKDPSEWNELEFYDRAWRAAKTVVKDWECEAIPDLDDFDMAESTDPKAANVVFWTCNAVSGHMNGLGQVPKNE